MKLHTNHSSKNTEKALHSGKISEGFARTIMKKCHTIFIAISNGIPLELAFFLTPEKKNAVINEFQTELQKYPSHTPPVKVRALQKILKIHFPDLEKGMPHWRNIQNYFFEREGLGGALRGYIPKDTKNTQLK